MGNKDKRGKIDCNLRRSPIPFIFLFTLSVIRGGSRAAAASKMRYFVIIVNDFQSLTTITESASGYKFAK